MNKDKRKKKKVTFSSDIGTSSISELEYFFEISDSLAQGYSKVKKQKDSIDQSLTKLLKEKTDKKPIKNIDVKIKKLKEKSSKRNHMLREISEEN
tara:strand:- start:136 stop:420 length:285 start_codon:yes stop_codon:yes gene_type:complete